MGISISALLKTQTDPGASRHTGTGQTARGGGTNPSPGQPSTTASRHRLKVQLPLFQQMKPRHY